MTNNEFMVSVLRTISEQTHVDAVDTRLLHGAMGAVTEAAELMSAIKASIFYGKPLDNVNLIEEIGDMMWFIFLMLNSLNVSLETVMDINSAKLKARYPNGFSGLDAVRRDLENERSVLENMT